MSDTLRDLVVSLSLNSNDFDKNIRLISKQIKEAESEFNLAAAGVEGFENSLAGFRAKAELIRKQLDGQNKAVDQYTRKLQAAQKRLEDESGRHAVISERLVEERKERDRLKEVVDEQTKRVLELTKAQGADSAATNEARNKLAEYVGEQQNVNEAIKTHESQLVAIQKQVNKTDGVIQNARIGLNDTQAKVKELTHELKLNENAWYTHGLAMQSFAGRVNTTAESLDRTGSRLTATVTTPLLALGGAAVKASIDYEDAFASVRKTIEVTGEDAEVFFQNLSDSVVDMSTQFATSATDIAEVMAIAGQLGIENDRLEEFTETIIRMGMSTNLAGEEAASQMARFANITGMQQSEFGRMGSTLVELGNKFATTEAEIMSMAMRIAAAGTQVGMEEQEILGFAAALSSLGIEAEAGGSAFSKALKKMEVAVATGSDELNDFAKVAGMTRSEFAAIWEENPAEAFQAFIVGLANLDEQGISAIATLEEIGITELRLSDTLLRSTNAYEVLADAQVKAAYAWEDGTALIEESEKRLDTTASRLTNIKNSLIATGMQFADTMAPELERVVGWLEDTVEWISNLDEGTRRNIVNMAMWAAGIGPVIKGLGKATGAVGTTIETVGKLAEAFGKANVKFKETRQASLALGTLLGPGGKVMLGVTAAAAAIYGLYRLYDYYEKKRPDFTMNTEEIESYRIDVDTLKTEIDVEADVGTITGTLATLEDTLLDVLNDGVPETQAVRDELQTGIDDAVGEIYAMIEESYNAKKTELDTLFSQGVIDQETYDSALNTLNEDAETMKADLETKGSALSTYVTTLCDNNRAMTQSEIDTLNQLLAALGETAEQVQTATDAQMNAYRLSYDKTRLGYGTEEDHERAAQYIELLAAQRKAEIEAKIKALETLYAETTEGKSDEEIAEELAKLEEQRKALEEELAEIERMRQEAHGGLTGSILEQYGFTPEEILAAAEALEEFNKQDKKYKPLEKSVYIGAGGTLVKKHNELEEEQDLLDSLYTRLAESGLLEGETTITSIIATLIGDGVLPEDAMASNEAAMETVTGLITGADEAEKALEGLKTGTYTTAAAVMTDAALGITDNKDAFVGAAEGAGTEAGQALKEGMNSASSGGGMNSVGYEAMMGIRAGILAGESAVIAAGVGVVQAMLKATKAALGIHSPSKVFEDEVGKMAMQGFGKGFEDEAAKQAKAIRNASRYLTGEAQSGAIAGAADNRRTYNSSSSVTVTGNTFVLNDRQDVEALATEIATLTSTQQRGRGERYA